MTDEIQFMKVKKTLMSRSIDDLALEFAINWLQSSCYSKGSYSGERSENLSNFTLDDNAIQFLKTFIGRVMGKSH